MAGRWWWWEEECPAPYEKGGKFFEIGIVWGMSRGWQYVQRGNIWIPFYRGHPQHDTKPQ